MDRRLGATRDDGLPHLEVRLGGIYALERIAHDSPRRDYGPIMEVLTAYVREDAPAPAGDEDLEETRRNGRRARAAIQTILTVFERALPRKRLDLIRAEEAGPRADIRAILTVLGHRTEEQRKLPPERLDLSRTDLRRAVLRDAHLEGAVLEDADLREAVLTETHLEGAFLTNMGADHCQFHSS